MKRNLKNHFCIYFFILKLIHYLMNISNLSDLMRELLDFKYLFEKEDFESILSDVLKVYLGVKHVSSIELGDAEHDIRPFVDCMDTYFFTGVFAHNESEKKFTGEIFVSRFKRYIKSLLMIKNKLKTKNEIEDEMAEMIGLFYGYSPEEIMNYCIKENLTELIK